MTKEKKEEPKKEQFKKEESPEVPEGKTLVDKDFMKQIQEHMKRQEKQIGMLTEIADKKRLAQWQVKNKEKLPTEVRIRKLTVTEKDKPVEKAVIGWRTVSNEMVYDPSTRKGYENQRVEILFQDGTKKEMGLRDFEVNKGYIKCQRVGQIVDDNTGEVAFKLQRMDTGEKITIGVKYVN